MLISHCKCIRRYMVCPRIKDIELSSRIGAVTENNVWRKCMCVVHQPSVDVLDVTVKRTRMRDVLSSSCEYRKSIRVNLRILSRMATNRFPHTGKAETLSEIRDKDAWRYTARPHARHFFVERLCKYYRRRKPNSTQTESFHVWVKVKSIPQLNRLLCKEISADNRCYWINKLFLQILHFIEKNL